MELNGGERHREVIRREGLPAQREGPGVRYECGGCKWLKLHREFRKEVSSACAYPPTRGMQRSGEVLTEGPLKGLGYVGTGATTPDWCPCRGKDQPRELRVCKTPLTDREQEVYAALASFITRTGRPPLMRELAETMGFSMTTAFAYLRTLKRKGCVNYSASTGSLRITETVPTPSGKCSACGAVLNGDVEPAI